MATGKTYLTLNAECAEALGMAVDVEVEVTYSVEQDSFDHEFGTEYSQPYLEISTVVVLQKFIDIVEILSDEMIEQLNKELLPSRNAYKWNWTPDKRYKLTA